MMTRPRKKLPNSVMHPTALRAAADYHVGQIDEWRKIHPERLTDRCAKADPGIDHPAPRRYVPRVRETLLTVLPLTLLACSSAAPAPFAAARPCAAASPDHACFPAGATPVTVTCAQGECDVAAGGRPVVRVYHFGDAAAVLAPLPSPADDPVRRFLVCEYQGDGCPVMYRVLAVEPQGQAEVSDAFGNCQEPEQSAALRAGELVWRFAADADTALPAPRPAVEVRYSLADRRLTVAKH